MVQQVRTGRLADGEAVRRQLGDFAHTRDTEPRQQYFETSQQGRAIAGAVAILRVDDDIRLFGELLGDHRAIDCRLRLDERILTHSGLGSHAVCGAALLGALNAMYGHPFSDEELTEIFLLNYVERSGARKVRSAVSTGIAFECLRGGMVCLSAQRREMARIGTDRALAVVAIITRNQRLVRRRGAASQRQNGRAPNAVGRGSLAEELFASIAEREHGEFLRLARVCAAENVERVEHGYGLPSGARHMLALAQASPQIDVYGVTSDGPSLFAIARDHAAVRNLAEAWRGAGIATHVVVSKIGRAMQSNATAPGEAFA